MRTYAFRIQCKLAGSDLGTSEREFFMALQASTPPITVNLPEGERPIADQFLTLWCGGFPSEEAARAEGMRVKTAVMLAGVMLGFGIDVGTDQVMSPAVQWRGSQSDERFQPDVHGLQVVPEIEGKIYFGGYIRNVKAHLVHSRFHEDFRHSVAQSYSLNKTPTEKQTLAAQLYSQSHFHLSDTARFLTLVSAIEALAEQRPRSPAAVALIDRMMEMSTAAENPDDLNNGLGNLKQESIRSACRRLVKTYCESVVTHAVHTCMRAYTIRSRLLHDGRPPPGTDLAVELGTLDLLVRHLIVRHVAFS
jgi:hypothetical protein